MRFWDVATRKEILKIETRPGNWYLEGALLSPDGKTLYLPDCKESRATFERGGKKVRRYTYSGAIRSWDVLTGKEKDSYQPAAGTGACWNALVPGGRSLLG